MEVSMGIRLWRVMSRRGNEVSADSAVGSTIYSCFLVCSVTMFRLNQGTRHVRENVKGGVCASDKLQVISKFGR